MARPDVRHQPETLCSGRSGELHQVAHVLVLVSVVEIEFPARQGIGQHQKNSPIMTLGRFAGTFWPMDHCASTLVANITTTATPYRKA
jgi:hypothetical protein